MSRLMIWIKDFFEIWYPHEEPVESPVLSRMQAALKQQLDAMIYE